MVQPHDSREFYACICIPSSNRRAGKVFSAGEQSRSVVSAGVLRTYSLTFPRRTCCKPSIGLAVVPVARTPENLWGLLSRVQATSFQM